MYKCTCHALELLEGEAALSHLLGKEKRLFSIGWFGMARAPTKIPQFTVVSTSLGKPGANQTQHQIWPPPVANSPLLAPEKHVALALAVAPLCSLVPHISMWLT